MIYISDEERKVWEALYADFESDLLWGTTKLKDRLGDRPVDNRKWALIKVGEKDMTVPVDNVTMKAYETDGYEWTDREIPEYTFVRWARGMDL
jgi:hypothetical protein